MPWSCCFLQVIEKLSAKTPDGQTKLKMLAAIAKELGVDWEPHIVEEHVSDLLETKIVSLTKRFDSNFNRWHDRSQNIL